ncbi:reverse transcriptase domain-containing protein [Tanacetum coccineum]|uniref:Reverse transcriptase domain-containing protein n=1 Tax=Tanacetum coccineum TaxID=301880 RepID=A0ABQ5EWY6_9ASTR
MPFGLKNAEATYQRLVDKAFQKQIGRNLEVYVDDLVIKSRTKLEIMRDIEETFKTLREINMKLNPKKCTFGIEEGMFLGYKVNTKVIKVCPDKVEAVLSIPSPKCLKDVHKLNGKLASLNRFLSKLTEKSLPFFKTLKNCTKKSDFQWTVKAEVAFKQMKKLIAELPTLTAPMKIEELIVYLAAAQEAYRRRTSVKGQILADFIVERLEDDPPRSMEAEEELSDPWRLFTDGSSCVDSFRAGLILTNPKGAEFTYAVRFRFDATNNEAEYKALIAIEELNEKSINKVEVSAVVEEERDTWMTPINNYLTKETLLAEKEKARATHKSGRICGSKGHTDRILLANNARGCKKTDNRMPRVPGSPPLAKKPVAKTDSHHVPVAIYKWGIHIAGTFPRGPGKVKFLIVAMDYFTKWIKAKPAHHIMIKSSNGDTPFLLTYGTEAVIPAKIGMPTLRTAEIDMHNDEALEINLNLLEERREQAAIRGARSKAEMENYYNSKVRNTSFKPGDLVYRNNDASHEKDSGKLSPK